MCKETFPIGTIISVVDFAENYTLQPQNETQSQYYNSIWIAIFVHITYRHAPDSVEDNQKTITEYHFFVEEGSIGDKSDCAIVRDSSKMHLF